MTSHSRKKEEGIFFSFETTKEEIDYCLEALAELLPVLRRYVRR